MCPPKVDKPEIVAPDPAPRAAEEQLSLATRIADDTRRRRLAAFRESLNPTGSRGLLTTPATTRNT